MAMSEFDTSPASSPPQPPVWFPGFDWLRAIFITFVVSMHLNLAQEFAGKSIAITIPDLVYSQIFCTAVPGFLLIAVFLQFVKRPGKKTTLNQFEGLFYLYAFWVAVWVLLTRARPEASLLGVICFLLQGGGWAYYYFTLLILVQLLRSQIQNWSDRWLWTGFVLAQLVIAGIFWQMALDGHSWMRVPTYWWPVCALPVPFAAGLLARHRERICSHPRTWALLVTGCLLASGGAAAWEWSLAAPGGQDVARLFLPEYLRLSPLLMGIALVLISLKLPPPPKVIAFISRNALGIFCLHVFCLGGIHLGISRMIPNPAAAVVVTLAVVLLGMSLLAELMRKVFKSRLV